MRCGVSGCDYQFRNRFIQKHQEQLTPDYTKGSSFYLRSCTVPLQIPQPLFTLQISFHARRQKKRQIFSSSPSFIPRREYQIGTKPSLPSRKSLKWWVVHTASFISAGAWWGSRVLSNFLCIIRVFASEIDCFYAMDSQGNYSFTLFYKRKI